MGREYHFWTYILTNNDRTVMYTGVTNNLRQRLKEHYDNRGNNKTFAGRYYAYNLVYYEYTTYINNAIYREKEIKSMNRVNKMAMITTANPDWKFLNIEICGEWPPTFEGRLQKDKDIDIPRYDNDNDNDNDADDEWYTGLTPPPM